MQSQSSYEAAEDVKYSTAKRLKFLLKFLALILKSLILSVPYVLRKIKEIFVSPQQKSIYGQLALVTGGSNGIGKAIAFRLAREGCNIAIANRNIIEGERTANEIREKFNVKAQAFKVDVSKVEEVFKMKDDVEKSMGSVDILINNAGLLSMMISLLEGTPKEIQNIVDVNLTSYFWVKLY